MSQTEQIIKIMETGESITALDALKDIGCFRLAARINDLRKAGYDIITEDFEYKNRWGDKKNIASYRLAMKAEQKVQLPLF